MNCICAVCASERACADDTQTNACMTSTHKLLWNILIKIRIFPRKTEQNSKTKAKNNIRIIRSMWWLEYKRTLNSSLARSPIRSLACSLVHSFAFTCIHTKNLFHTLLHEGTHTHTHMNKNIAQPPYTIVICDIVHSEASGFKESPLKLHSKTFDLRNHKHHKIIINLHTLSDVVYYIITTVRTPIITYDRLPSQHRTNNK